MSTTKLQDLTVT